jgi:hypothetical protein
MRKKKELFNVIGNYTAIKRLKTIREHLNSPSKGGAVIVK